MYYIWFSYSEGLHVPQDICTVYHLPVLSAEDLLRFAQYRRPEVDGTLSVSPENTKTTGQQMHMGFINKQERNITANITYTEQIN